MSAIDRQGEFMLEHRRKVLLLIVAVLVVILGGRLLFLQVVKKDYYHRLAISNRIQRERIVAPRGIIRSSDGSKLVVNIPVYQINVMPGKLGGNEERFSIACKWLGVDEAKLRADIDEWVKRYPDGRDMTVIQAADKGQISILNENKSYFPFFRLVMKHKRQYPEGPLAAHILGYVGEVTDDELKEYPDFSPGDVTGRTGVELIYEKFLRGEDGIRIVEVSAEGTKVGEFDRSTASEQMEGLLDSHPAVPGFDVYLTLNLGLQRKMEELFDWPKGCVIAMDPSNGAILGAVSRPGYDPNLFAGGIKADDWKALNEDPDKPLFNRSVQATYPPASTFKVIVAYAALKNRLVTRDQTLEPCMGRYKFGNRYFRCWKSAGHGYLDMYEAIVNSCDIYFYQIAEMLPADEFAYAGRLFGLGRDTRIDLPSEVPGILPDHAYFDRKFGKHKWTKGHLLNYAIGQGDALTTPVQLCQMAAMIGNGGKRIRPHVVEKVVNPDGLDIYEIDEGAEVVPQIDQGILAFIKRAMVGVVNDENGTGKGAAQPDVRVAGKTGTAQNSGIDHALFICYAPAESPEIALAIVMENAGHGGAMAAPIAGKILSAYFNPLAGWDGSMRYCMVGGRAAGTARNTVTTGTGPALRSAGEAHTDQTRGGGL